VTVPVDSTPRRVGALVSGVVRQVAGDELTVTLDTGEAVVPAAEQLAGEQYAVGDRFVGVVIGTGAPVVLSRTSPTLVERLFEREVPSLARGEVIIEGSARRAGEGALIAVRAARPGTDAVDLMLGPEGGHLQAVKRALGGEPVRVIAFDRNPLPLACNALPATVVRATLDLENDAIHLVVPDDQMRVALGPDGINVILASLLTGHAIDVYLESTAPRPGPPSGAKPS
jgi:N utilization substance protein A